MSSLPRSKTHQLVNGGGASTTVCADCSAADPQWASLNRGVLICAECCNVHRSLGRHVSQVRSMKKGNWHSAQLALVFALYKNGVNNVWEHSLLDPQSSSKIRRKPTQRDPVYPTKAEFIRAKYEQLAFSLKPSKEDGPLSLADLNRQLYSCVRTSHIETTLRLLSQGADPNYADPDRGTTPLHVAAKESQTLQVELLYLYGADPDCPDSAGVTPSEAARLEGMLELADRLEELKFEVTDRLTMFLCDRKPDHSKGRHFLIPELAPDCAGSGGRSNKRANARKLHALSTVSFERLVQDVYDEVDRREVDASWQQTMLGLQPLSQVNEVIVPFLPVNQAFSATRNQSRQKLAKFSARDFAALIIDVLGEAKRRYTDEDDGALLLDDDVEQQLQPSAGLISKERSEEAQDYDFVPDSPRKSEDSARRSSTSVGNKTSDTGDFTAQLPTMEREVALDDFLEMKDRIIDNESKMEDMMRANGEIMRELRNLHLAVDRLTDENVQLRMELRGSQPLRSPRPSPTPAAYPSANGVAPPTFAKKRPPAMPAVERTASNSDVMASFRSNSARTQLDAGLCTSNASAPTGVDDEIIAPLQYEQQARNGSAPLSHLHLADRSQQHITYPDNLIFETEQLTVAIKSLLADVQNNRLPSSSNTHAIKIRSITDRLVNMVPVEQRHGSVERCLAAMVDACIALTVKCNAMPVAPEETCQAAYGVAKSAKLLLNAINIQTNN